MKKKFDNIFDKMVEPKNKFSFNKEVARVFDNMASRSIPYYREVEEATAFLAKAFFQPNTVIYDLGFSTANTILFIMRDMEDGGRSDFLIKGYETSKAMIEEAHKKINSFSFENKHLVELEYHDINNCEIKNSSVVILNYTLQFIPLEKREALLKKIYEGLNSGGILIISNKTEPSLKKMRSIFEQRYYNFKKDNGYSQLEISAKRDALENVLIPISFEEEFLMLKKTGFFSVSPFWSWFNFSSFVCVK